MKMRFVFELSKTQVEGFITNESDERLIIFYFLRGGGVKSGTVQQPPLCPVGLGPMLEPSNRSSFSYYFTSSFSTTSSYFLLSVYSDGFTLLLLLSFEIRLSSAFI